MIRNSLQHSVSFQFKIWVTLFLILLFIVNCGQDENVELINDEYILSILEEREEKDSIMVVEPHSPFNRDTTIEFTPLKYFEPNKDFVFQSRLFKSDPPDTVKIMGTRGEARTVVVEGQVELNYEGGTHRVNIYKGFSRSGEAYYSIWFTDRSTGKETYGVGRYLDFELKEDPGYIYTIDFNLAYNPYCAYSALFTCPIPREEDFIDIYIEAGEKSFH